jgi:hypothetical protein
MKSMYNVPIMQLLNFVTNYLKIVFGNIWGILLLVSTALGLGERFIEKKIKIPLWIRIALIVGIVFVAQVAAYKQLADVPPTVLRTPTPPAPVIQKQEPLPVITRSPASKPDTKPPVQINSAPNGFAIGGGMVTNPTVNNFGPTERHLSIEQIQALNLEAASLPEDSPSWFSIETINTPESSNLASEIKNAFGDRTGGVVTRLVENPPVPKGVFVIVSGMDSEHFGIAQKIANALGNSVFLTRFEPVTGLTSKQVKVVVESN